MPEPEKPEPPSKRVGWLQLIALVVLGYVLSSGPMIALGCWLREATGRNEFYAVMWLYAPLTMFGHGTPLMSYIEWWVVDLFGTVGPG